MIARWILHLEFHRGYRPRISLRRAPRAGQRTVDGGLPGTLVRCRECGGEGLLHQADAGVRERQAADVLPPGPYTSTPTTRTEIRTKIRTEVAP